MTTIQGSNRRARQALTGSVTHLTASMAALDRRTIEEARSLAACEDADAINAWLADRGRGTVTGAAVYAAGFGTLAAMITELAALAEKSLEGAR